MRSGGEWATIGKLPSASTLASNSRIILLCRECFRNYNREGGRAPSRSLSPLYVRARLGSNWRVFSAQNDFVTYRQALTHSVSGIPTALTRVSAFSMMPDPLPCPARKLFVCLLAFSFGASSATA